MESASADVMIAVHVLEHFYQWEVQPLLTEWKRVMKPGGILILELPNIDKVLSYIKACMDRREPVRAQMTWWALWGDPGYHDPMMCHRWGYTETMLEAALKEAGFERVTFETPRYHIPKRDMRAIAYKGEA